MKKNKLHFLLSNFRVPDALKALRRYKADHLVPIASVATGFPSGQFPLKTRLEEIQWAVEAGASEIDIVINRTLALKHDWTGVYQVMQPQVYNTTHSQSPGCPRNRDIE